jgi:hypothetical protein
VAQQSSEALTEPLSSVFGVFAAEPRQAGRFREERGTQLHLTNGLNDAVLNRLTMDNCAVGRQMSNGLLAAGET